MNSVIVGEQMDKKRFIERTPKKDLELDTCDECGKVYQPKIWWQKNCEDKCRLVAYRRRNPRITPAILKDIENMKKDNVAMKEKLGME